MDWLGIDIGGANIKAATTRGQVLSVPFPLWKQPETLTRELTSILARFASDRNRLAVTMTGELADCFRTKAEGVRFIVDAVEKAADSCLARFYTTQGSFIAADAARNDYLRVAAANWHALASFSTRYLARTRESQSAKQYGRILEDAGNRLSESSLLLDIGSTTTDIIPIRKGAAAACGLTDTDRLIASELVYTGVARTPLCAMVQQVSYRGRNCAIARELFATMLDVYLMLDEIPESNDISQTADGRVADKHCAIDRLARMICADREIFDARDAVDLSRQAREVQINLLGHAVLAVAEKMPLVQQVVISGQGEFLSREIVQRFLPDAEIISLTAKMGPQLSHVAPAYAVAVLAAENVEA